MAIWLGAGIVHDDYDLLAPVGAFFPVFQRLYIFHRDLRTPRVLRGTTEHRDREFRRVEYSARGGGIAWIITISRGEIIPTRNAGLNLPQIAF